MTVLPDMNESFLVQQPARRRGRAGIVIGLVSLAVSGSACSPDPVSHQPLLSLDEVTHWSIPDSIPVGGVETLGDVVVTWDPRFRGVVVTTDSSERIGVSSVANPIAVAADSQAGGLQVVDGGRNGVVTLDINGSEVGFRRSRLPVRLEAAALTPLGWIIGGFAANGSFSLFQGAQDPTSLWSSRDFSSGPGLSPLVSYQGPNLIVANRRAPFVIHTLGVGPSHLTSESRINLDDDLKDPSTWVLAGIVSIPGTYIVTLADVTSDRRLVLVLSQRGEVVRSRSFNDPFVLLRRQGSGRILGARYVGATEIVEYLLADSTLT